MAQLLIMRGSNTEDVSTATEAPIYVLGIHPNLALINETDEYAGAARTRKRGAREIYSVRCHPFSVEPTSTSGMLQDHQDLRVIQRLFALFDNHWAYSVTGSSRLDHAGAAFFDSLPVSVTVVGDPRSTTNYDGTISYEFEIEAVLPSFS